MEQQATLVQQLLTELSAAAPDTAFDSIVRFSPDTWGVAFPDETCVTLELTAGGAKLVLAADLGAVPEATQANFHEMALAYNALWRTTGGVRIAVVRGEASQLFDLETAGLDVERFSTVLANFADAARGWRGYLANGGSAPSKAPGDLTFGIRA
jgi:hypothetical protein